MHLATDWTGIIGESVAMEAHHGKVLQPVEFRMVALLAEFEKEYNGEQSGANNEDGDQASKQRIQWRRRRHYVYVWIGGNTNTMEFNACKREYPSSTPGLWLLIPWSPTSSSDGPSWFSFPKEAADPVIKSVVRVEAGREGGIKDTLGIVSEVVDWEEFWCSSLRLVDEGMDGPGVMVVLLSGMRDGVICKEPRAKWRRNENRFGTRNAFWMWLEDEKETMRKLWDTQWRDPGDVLQSSKKKNEHSVLEY